VVTKQESTKGSWGRDERPRPRASENAQGDDENGRCKDAGVLVSTLARVLKTKARLDVVGIGGARRGDGNGS